MPEEGSGEKTKWVQWTPCLLLAKKKKRGAACHSYLHPRQDAPSVHALSPSPNWIYNLQPLRQNPQYGSMAVTVKNKKEKSLPLPEAFLAPKHKSTLYICFFKKCLIWNNNVNLSEISGWKKASASTQPSDTSRAALEHLWVGCGRTDAPIVVLEFHFDVGHRLETSQLKPGILNLLSSYLCNS